MIKNVTLKKILKSSVFKVVSVVNKFVPKDDNIVLLYSANKGIQHSLIPMRDYLLANNFHKRYRVVCGIEDMKYAENIEGVEFMSRMNAFKLFMKAKHVFYTTGQVPIKPSKEQIVIHLRHGNTNFKSFGKKTKINNGDEFFFTHMICSAPMFKKIMAEEMDCPEANITVAGDPLIDMLLNSMGSKEKYDKYDKLILWMPTFRQSDYLGYNDSQIEDLVPMFSEKDYPAINSILEKYNIKLIVKLHPAQKAKEGEERHFEYFDVYTHDEFVNEGLNTYELMSISDSLIGDYSSASMQYLVLNRPLAFVIPDIDEYKEKRGFVFEHPEDYMAGHIIKSKDEFWKYIADISLNKDIYKEKRECVIKEVYSYTDNKNCERIVKLSGMK